MPTQLPSQLSSRNGVLRFKKRAQSIDVLYCFGSARLFRKKAVNINEILFVLRDTRGELRLQRRLQRPKRRWIRWDRHGLYSLVLSSDTV